MLLINLFLHSIFFDVRIIKPAILFILLFTYSSVLCRAQQWHKSFYGIESYFNPDEVSGDIAILFAGWKVEMPWAKVWSEALYKERLFAMGVRKLYAVQGPDKVAFESLEIETKALAKAIRDEIGFNEKKNLSIRIIAHSSGAYVAHNFLTHLFANSTSKLPCRISYFCLDGGIGTTVFGTTLTTNIVDKLDDLIAVYAFDPVLKIKSANAGIMYNLAEQFAPKARLRAIETQDSGCGSRWCLHESLVNRRPYTVSQFDLEGDYSRIDPLHPVCWEYLVWGE